jgi:hypothetical protein
VFRHILKKKEGSCVGSGERDEGQRKKMKKYTCKSSDERGLKLALEVQIGHDTSTRRTKNFQRRLSISQPVVRTMHNEKMLFGLIS